MLLKPEMNPAVENLLTDVGIIPARQTNVQRSNQKQMADHLESAGLGDAEIAQHLAEIVQSAPKTQDRLSALDKAIKIRTGTVEQNGTVINFIIQDQSVNITQMLTPRG